MKKESRKPTKDIPLVFVDMSITIICYCLLSLTLCPMHAVVQQNRPRRPLFYHLLGRQHGLSEVYCCLRCVEGRDHVLVSAVGQAFHLTHIAHTHMMLPWLAAVHPRTDTEFPYFWLKDGCKPQRHLVGDPNFAHRFLPPCMFMDLLLRQPPQPPPQTFLHPRYLSLRRLLPPQPHSMGGNNLLHHMFTTISTKGTSRLNYIASIVHMAVIVFVVITGLPKANTYNLTPFTSLGRRGNFPTSVVLFFTYVGFDAIFTMTEGTRNLAKDNPFGLINTMSITTVSYCLVSPTLCLMHVAVQ
ncbi:Cationic amino acid transporter 1 [Platanthera guangdongensis]|uniref:Cationic amino acid transporter 1 n=1 Tax=Platanthera guangdongensis TaxID=2320717 RepID=A0ABR2MNR9_9ASPA